MKERERGTTERKERKRGTRERKESWREGEQRSKRKMLKRTMQKIQVRIKRSNEESLG